MRDFAKRLALLETMRDRRRTVHSALEYIPDAGDTPDDALAEARRNGWRGGFLLAPKALPEEEWIQRASAQQDRLEKDLAEQMAGDALRRTKN